MQIEFCDAAAAGITVFETMRQEADGRVALWDLHLARLSRGCAALGFAFDEDTVNRATQGEGAPDDGPQRLRVSVDALGRVAVQRQALPANPDQWQVTLSPVRLASDDPWLRIKSSHRPAYDRARALLPTGVDEAILMNQRGEVCEGSITSLFLRRGDMLLTPPLDSGLLPGVLRQSLLDRGAAREARLYPGDLADGELLMGNALRGLIPARLRPAAAHA